MDSAGNGLPSLLGHACTTPVSERPDVPSAGTWVVILEACRTISSARVRVLLVLPLNVPQLHPGLTICPQIIIQSTLPL